MTNYTTEPFVQMTVRMKFLLPLVFLLSTFLLIISLPSKTDRVYTYEEGRPWHYEQLIAPFDFPILLSEKEVREQQDSAMRQFAPYFMKSDSVHSRQIRLFVTDFDKGVFQEVPVHYRTHLIELLTAVYQAGMMSSSEYQQLLEQRSSHIRLIDGKEAMLFPVEKVYTPRSAYDFIMSNDNEYYSREVLQNIDFTDYLTPNLSLDTAKTREAEEEMKDNLSRSRGMVQVGERIIDRGEIITAQKYSVISSYFKEQELHRDQNGVSWSPLLGKSLIILLILVGSFLYLRNYRAENFFSVNRILLYLVMIAAFPLLTYIMIANSWLNIYILPYPMVAIFVRIFYDSRTATQVLLANILLASLAVSDPFGFILLQLAMGMSAIYAVNELTERAQLFRVGVISLSVGLFFCAIYDFYQGIALTQFLQLFDRSRYICVAISGVLLLLSYPLLYAVERLFNLTSEITLIELSNINHPILRRMTKVAQGTFNHSLQVGNLAAEVADAIGADAQLVRTAAFYHDIGKTLNPAYFTENQTGKNPHDDLTEEESAKVIINHVTEGVKLAEKYHLPPIIREFIPTHHGCSKTGYFYVQWKNKHNGEEPPEEMFTYPGPNPWTREQAILMMCDSVEASSRSLTEYSDETITHLVNAMIDKQQAAGYFNDSPLTFRDITIAKRVLIDSLKVIYHTRIAYPEEEAPSSRWFPGRRRRGRHW